MLRSAVRVLLLTLVAGSFAVGAQAQTATLVRDIRFQGPGEGWSPESFYSTPEKLFFFGGGLDGWGVWASDGSSSGTTLLVDLCVLGNCSVEGHAFLGQIGNTVLWVSDPTGVEPQLWRSDGTRPGTYPLAGPGTAIPNALDRTDASRSRPPGRTSRATRAPARPSA
ncbi:MAG TPA: hypothetical protein VFR31_19225 [Thermoanaerobaculia bacterium]|nr:hypothetical protein [Thermoanaerobaculia bacterium]